jgi:sugar phosphate isomerase/epimerase
VKVAFSTAACPEWTWDEVITKAADFGFDGIEWRFPEGPDLRSVLSRSLAAEIGTATVEAGLGVPAFDCGLVIPIGPEPERLPLLAVVSDGLETARLLRAERLVVAPGPYPELVTDAEAATWLGAALTSLKGAMGRTGVRLALDLKRTLPWDRARLRAKTCSAFLNEALWNLDLPEVGVQWDLGESYLEGERADQVWDNVWRWFSYLQIRDMDEDKSGWRNVDLGTGKLPVSFALAYVGGPKYTGWTSLNWDRQADPSLAPADEVLAAFIRFISDYQ